MSSKKGNIRRTGPSKAPAKSSTKPKPKNTKPVKRDDGIDYILDMITTMEDIINLVKEKSRPDIFKMKSSKRSSGERSVLDAYRTYLERYKAVLKHTDFEVHGKMFLREYEKNRKSFLNIMDDDDFLLDRKRDIQIWYGEEYEETKKKNCRLPFSLFYRYTSDMRHEISKKLTGDAENDAKIQIRPQYIIGSELLYCFLLVVREYAGPKYPDYKLWTPILKELASEAHIGNKNTDYSGFDRVINTVFNAVEKAGYTDVDGTPITSENRPATAGILGMVEELMDGGVLTDAMGGMTGNINKNDPVSIQDAMLNVTKSVLPKIAEALVDASNPPPGVHVSEESQSHADSMVKNMRAGLKKATKTISEMDFDGTVPRQDSGEPESDTDPGSESSSDSGLDSSYDSELDECSDSDSSDSEESG